MFARKNRISKQKDFDKIFEKGKTIKNSFFKIVFLNNDLNINRFSIIVNKKVSKNAFKRNSLKRIIRNEIILFNFEKNNYDIIIIVFPNILDNINVLSNEVKKTLNKINIY